MPDIFDTLAQQPKGDVFDAIAPGKVQNLNSTDAQLLPLDNSLMGRFKRSGLGQELYGPDIQPPVGIHGVVPTLTQLAFGSIKPEDSKGVGVMNFSPAAVMPQQTTYPGAIGKVVLSQANVENLTLAKLLEPILSARQIGTGVNALRAGTAAYLAEQGAQGVGQNLGMRLSGVPQTPEEKAQEDVGVGLGGLMTLSPLALGGEARNPALENTRNVFDPNKNRYVSGEMTQGSREFPFTLPDAPVRPRFYAGEEAGDVFDRIKPEPDWKDLKRPSQQAPVVIGEQPQGTRVITPEDLQQSSTSVQPVGAATREPQGDVGGKVSFRGEGVPSTGQSSAMLPMKIGDEVAPILNQLISKLYPKSTPGMGGMMNVTQPETGFTVEGFRAPDKGAMGEANRQLQGKFAQDLLPAVRMGDKVVKAGPDQITHNDILKGMGMTEGDVPVWSKDRGFVDGFGKWYSREDAARLSGLPTGVEPGRLHSTDLPRAKGGETSEPIEEKVKENEGQQGVGGTHGAGTTVLSEEGKEGDESKKGEEPPTQQLGGRSMGGLFFLDPEFWKQSFPGLQGKKLDAQQLYNKIRNTLGKDSGAWKGIDTEEFRKFMVGGSGERKSPEEVKEWMEKDGPKVEVRKFGETSQTPEQKEFAQLQHWRDSLRDEQKLVLSIYNQPDSNQLLYDFFNKGEELDKAKRYTELSKSPQTWSQANASHWQFIAPKSESQMPGYTEIAVVKPQLRATKDIDPITGKPQMDTVTQFPSSHNFPRNTLGFARGYMETLSNGKKVFHVIEVQSDWAQKRREHVEQMRKAGFSEEQINRVTKNGVGNDPLLPHYERLALKAAIDHARSEGADAIAISDAETAMMTEGHDRAMGGGGRMEAHITQAPGMRLHYDRTLPKILEELTGEKGERVGFGEHKMAFDTDPYRIPEGEPRKDLIFREPSGEPKTSITARQFPLSKARENFSLFGSDKPKPQSQAVAEPITGMGDKLYSGIPIFDPDLWQVSPEQLQAMKDKFAKRLQQAPEEIGKAVDALKKSKFINNESAQRILNNPTAQKIEKKGKVFNQPGERLSTAQQLHNAITPIINGANEADKVLNPWDVLFDWLDGGKAKFKGPLIQEIRIPFDDKFQQEGNMQEALTASLKDIVKKNKLKKDNEERIAVYLHAQQEGGRQRMIESGVKSGVIDNIVKNITPAEKEYADAWRKIDDQLYPQIRDVAQAADGVKVKQVANHFPWMRDFDKYQPEADEVATNPNLKKGSEVEAGDVLWPGLPLDLGARKTPGSIISRQKGARTPIRFDTFSIADRYIRDATHYISSRQLVKDTAKLVRSDEFSDKYGDLGQKLMNEFINTYARQGRYKKNIFIDTLKRNLGRAIIGARIPSQVLHLSNIPLAMKQTGAVWWQQGLNEALSERGQKFINDNFIETKMRGGGEPVQAEIAAQQGKTAIGRGFNNVSKYSFAVQRAIDQYNSQATVLGAYMKLLKENGKDPTAYAELPVDKNLIGEARIRARRAVASPIYKDVPPIVGRGGSLGRAFLQFQNVFLDQYSNARYEAMKVGIPEAMRGRPKELLITTGALMAMIAAETSIKHTYKAAKSNLAGKRQDDDSYTKELYQESLKRIPGVGQLQANVLYGEPGVPVLDAPIGALKEGYKSATGDKAQRIISGTKAATDVAETLGIPGTSQLGDIATSLEERQLYKSHEKRLSESSGKDVEGMTLQERISAEKKYKKNETPLSKDDQAKAAERNISNITKRGDEVYKTLDKPTQRWMESRGLTLPGFDNKLKVGGATVYLTDKETARLGELVKWEYEKSILQIKSQQSFDGMGSDKRKDVFDEVMVGARTRARRMLQGEMEKGKLSSENEPNQKEKKRFSIFNSN
jgi:hypothetical protein